MGLDSPIPCRMALTTCDRRILLSYIVCIVVTDRNIDGHHLSSDDCDEMALQLPDRSLARMPASAIPLMTLRRA